jgi:hypothetical protein
MKEQRDGRGPAMDRQTSVMTRGPGAGPRPLAELFGTMVPALGFLVPGYVTLAAPIFGAVSALPLWRRSAWRGAGAGALVTLVLMVPIAAPSGGIPALSAVWQLFRFIPMCSPDGALGWLLPSGLAIATYGAGLLVSVRRRNPWLWPAGAAMATAVFHLTLLVLTEAGLGFSC